MSIVIILCVLIQMIQKDFIASDGTLTYRTGGGKGYDFNSSGSSAGGANMFSASY